MYRGRRYRQGAEGSGRGFRRGAEGFSRAGRVSSVRSGLPHYNGPYPRGMLEDARRDLISLVDSADTIVWRRIWMKTGIHENGQRDLASDGWGMASQLFSHAGFEDNGVGMEQSHVYSGANGMETTAGPSSTANISNENDAKIMDEGDEGGSATDKVHPSEVFDTGQSASSSQMNSDIGQNANNNAMKPVNDVVSVTMTFDEKGRVTARDVVNKTGPESANKTSHITINDDESDIITIDDSVNESVITINDSAAHDADNSTIEIVEDVISATINVDEAGNVVIDDIADETASSSKEAMDVVSATLVVDEKGKVTVEEIVEESNRSTSEKLPSPLIKQDQESESGKLNMRTMRQDSYEMEDGEILGDDDDDINGGVEEEKSQGVQNDGGEAVAYFGKDTTEHKDTAEHRASTDSLASNSKHVTGADVPMEDMSRGLVSNASNSNGMVFKCDFCDTYLEDDSAMNHHLIKDVHFSASSYWIDEQKNVVGIKDKMSLTNKAAMFKTKLAVCAMVSCSKPFSNIFECAYHYKLEHDQYSEPIYGMVDVNEKTYWNRVDPLSCMHCGVPQTNVNKLASHYKRKCRQPFVNKGSRNKMYFVCPRCVKCFKTFQSVIAHQKKEHVSCGRVEMRVLEACSKSIHNLDDVGKQIGAADEEADVGDLNTPLLINGDGPNVEQNTNFTEDGFDREDGGFFIDRTPNSSADVFNAGIRSSLNQTDCRPSTSALEVVVDDSEDEEGEVGDEDIDVNSLQLKFKCDYCIAVSDNYQKMLTHLKTDLHCSASSVYVNKENKVMYLKKPLMIQNFQALFKKVVAVCPDPDCGRIFSDIFVCSEHFIQDHDYTGTEQCYAVTEIVNTDIAKYARSPKQCITCGDIFDKRRLLHRHIEKENHYHYKHVSDQYISFKCYYCPTFHSRFVLMADHLAKKHHHLEVESGMFLMHVLYLSPQRVKKRIPPFLQNPLSQRDCIRRKITNLNDLKRETTSKSERRELRSQIKQFKGLLNSC